MKKYYFNFVVSAFVFGAIVLIVGLASFITVTNSRVAYAATNESQKSYSYDHIDYTINVNEDSTFDVDEQQEYIFHGQYHAGERFIPLKGIGAITDVVVFDDSTGKPLEKTTSNPDKNDSSSWGKYTVSVSDGVMYIDWFYNLADTTHSWTIHYKVHGGIGFYKDHDELYWNLFQNYVVPIGSIRATVIIPENTFYNSPFTTARIYDAEIGSGTAAVVDHRTFLFTASNISPNATVTIATGWPKGIVGQASYWKDFVSLNWGILLLVFACISYPIFYFLFKYFTSWRPLHSKTIVPEYEPADNLRPAEMELVLHNKVSDRTWAATIVDLAVRGYVTIKEEESKILWWTKKNYIVEPTSAFKDATKNATLEKYEKNFLDLLFNDSNHFSTEELKKSSSSYKREFASELTKIKKELYKDTIDESKAYDIHPRVYGITTTIVVFGIIFALKLLQGIHINFNLEEQLIIAGVAVGGFLLAVFLTLRFAVRLNSDGIDLKRKLVGFKLYLKTAEQARLQNLTPDLFETFLPYAMVCKLEKQWAKAFDTIILNPPSWFVGPMNAGLMSNAEGASSIGAISGFSASAFSTSFTSSFSSAFVSSAGGAAGGGGSAGGGGGGGGGGAS